MPETSKSGSGSEKLEKSEINPKNPKKNEKRYINIDIYIYTSVVPHISMCGIAI